MIRTTLAALVVAAIATSVSTLPAAARDSVSIQFDPGSVAFGYTDGYWDHDHHWHKWHNTKEARAFRESNKDHYNGWKHDRDKDMGWHEEHH